MHIKDMYMKCWGEGSASKVLEVDTGGHGFDSQSHINNQPTTKPMQVQQCALLSPMLGNTETNILKFTG